MGGKRGSDRHGDTAPCYSFCKISRPTSDFRFPTSGLRPLNPYGFLLGEGVTRENGGRVGTVCGCGFCSSGLVTSA